MARGTLRCGLFLILGLSSIASAVLDLVSRVGTQVGTPTPTRTHADTPARAAIPYRTQAARSNKSGLGTSVRFVPFSPVLCALKLQTKL